MYGTSPARTNLDEIASSHKESTSIKKVQGVPVSKHFPEKQLLLSNNKKCLRHFADCFTTYNNLLTDLTGTRLLLLFQSITRKLLYSVTLTKKFYEKVIKECFKY